jgi:hypothetical protein
MAKRTSKKPASSTASKLPSTATAENAVGAKQAKAPDPKGRSGGFVDAPGKKHRKPAPSVKGAKHSDERVAKMRTVNARRQQRSGQA